MNSKISVIIPVYSVEQYLAECLDSVVNQTHQNLEIIIINDCSPDNSEKIILEYQQKDSRIKYVKHEKNLGLGGARNTGITHATGEYITFIDSDDWIEKDAYQNVLTLMQKSNSNLGVFSALLFDDVSKEVSYDPYYDPPFLFPPQKINALNIYNFSSTAWGKIYLTKDIKDKNITFPEFLKHEDEEFWHKYIAAIEPLAVGDLKTYYHYRQRENSITKQEHVSHKDMPKILFNIATFWKKNGYFEQYKAKLIDLLYQSTVWYTNLPDNYKETYVKEMHTVFNILEWSIDDAFNFNPKLLIFYTENPKLREKICLLTDNKGHSYGGLSCKQKIKKAIIRILKKIGLYSIIKKILKRPR
ncbi:MAG: glycosyltransferase family 2 protein [Brevinema sp.]